MKRPFIFKQYCWLIATIRKEKRITFADLSELWRQTETSGGLPLARRTFTRYRDDILNMFGISIECHKPTNRYYIVNAEELERDSVANWLLSTLTVDMLLYENVSLKDRILLERIPTTDVRLNAILVAMKSGRRIQMDYKRYKSDIVRSFLVEPYCLKLFNRRWYALMNVVSNGRESLLVFSVDRIVNVEVTDQPFTVSDDFDAEIFFSECFGVVVGDGTPLTDIVLRAYGRERFALKDLPIHPSQQLVSEAESYADFSLRLRPTSDFKAFLLGKGEWLIVISPLHLAEEIVKIHQDSLQKYWNTLKLTNN